MHDIFPAPPAEVDVVYVSLSHIPTNVIHAPPLLHKTPLPSTRLAAFIFVSREEGFEREFEISNFNRRLWRQKKEARMTELGGPFLSLLNTRKRSGEKDVGGGGSILCILGFFWGIF